jgi:hypothetical protein
MLNLSTVLHNEIQLSASPSTMKLHLVKELETQGFLTLLKLLKLYKPDFFVCQPLLHH